MQQRQVFKFIGEYKSNEIAKRSVKLTKYCYMHNNDKSFRYCISILEVHISIVFTKQITNK